MLGIRINQIAVMPKIEGYIAAVLRDGDDVLAKRRKTLTSMDVSEIDWGGHSVPFSPAVSYDLFFVLEEELPPEKRPWLWKIELWTGIHWKMLSRQRR